MECAKPKKRPDCLGFLRLGKLHPKCHFYGRYGETGFNHGRCEAEYAPAEKNGRVVLLAIGLEATAADVAAVNPASAFDLDGQPGHDRR